MDEELIFHDITDDSGFAPLTSIPYGWIMVTLGVIIVLIVLFLLRKKKPLIKVSCPYKDALKELSNKKNEINEKPLGKTASELSLLLRGALRKGTDSPSLFQSQQEFFLEKKLPLKNNELANRIIKHLNEMWKLEYAPPQINKTKVDELHQETRELLQRLSKQ